MIRCVPVDGSEAFEVPNDARVDRFESDAHIISSASAIASMFGHCCFAWKPRSHGRPVDCRIESWRDRAERLEHENALLRLARDYCAVPGPVNYIEAGYPHCYEPDRLDEERDAIEAKIVALGHSLAEAQNL